MRLRRDESGGVAILFMFMAVSLFGFVALALDTSLWYATKQRMQGAADAAARAGAHELQRLGATDADIVARAEADAAKNGFGPDTGATIDVVIDRQERTVAVDISRPLPLNFARLFLVAPPITAAHAAAAAPATAPPCLTLLDPNAAAALELGGQSRITAPTCRVQVNSVSGQALKLAGGTITAAQICVTGGVTGTGTSVPPQTGCPALPDPMAAWLPPEVPSACDYGAQSIAGVAVLQPGTYCGLIDIKASAVATFLPGLYVLKNGGLKVSGSAKVTGLGVGFLLAGTSIVDISSTAVVTLVAPVSGPLAGIIFTHAPDAPDALEHKLSGGATISYEGAIYLPRHLITYQGTSLSTNVPPFTTYIARRLKLDGNAHLILNNNFAASSVPVVGMVGAGVVLTE